MPNAAKPAPKRSRLRRDDRRNLILSTAADVVLSEGMKAASVDRIARSLGVSKGLVYQHFESRELMLATLVENEIDLLVAQGAFTMASQTHGFDARLRAVLRLVFGYADQRGPLLHLLTSEREVVDALSMRARTIWSQTKRAVRALITDEYRLAPAIIGDAVELTIAVAAQSARQVAERTAAPALAEDLAVSMIGGGLRSLAEQYRGAADK